MTCEKKLTAALLANLCDEAFHKFPNSCSHAVWHVIRGYKEDQEYLTANQLITRISSSPEWEEVQLSEVSKLASEGTLVVGGLKEKEHGHVIAVYPGEEKKRGGYDYYNKNTKELEGLAEKGSYARCLSTSIGNWPGAKSKGEKTVWDPWANDKKFKLVRFWKYVGQSHSALMPSTPRKQKREAGSKATEKPKWPPTVQNPNHSRWSSRTQTDCDESSRHKYAEESIWI